MGDMKEIKSVVWWKAIEYLTAFMLGGLIALVGTAVHRQWQPIMLLAALLVVLSGAIMMRAFSGMIAVGIYGVAWFVVVQILSLVGPGGDVLLPGQILSYVWLIGGLVMITIASFAPRKWFSERAHNTVS